MPDSDTTYTSSQNVSIPSFAINVAVEIAGGKGGGGGSDAGASAGSGGAGRRGIVYFPDYTARTLTLAIGGKGGNGSGCVANGGNGPGGAGGGGGGGRSGPSGCSGGGGGGGGQTTIYDNLLNAYVAIAAGGGGGGGASWNRSAAGGGNAGSFAAYNSAISPQNGGGGNSCPTDGGGGGGGGGGYGGGGGGSEGYDNNRGGGGGGGGGSAYRSDLVTIGSSTGTTNYGNGFARVTYDIGTPEITSFTVNPTAIIRGETATLSWSVDNAASATIDGGVGNASVPTGTATITPQNTTTYNMQAIGPGGTVDNASVSITVYIPPVLNLTLDNPSIILGGNTTLRWDTTGDADTIYWVAGGITNNNLNSFEYVDPSVTTTYSAYVTGLGGTSPVASVTLYVYYPPTLTVDYPTAIAYGQQGVIEYSGDYANTTVTLSATYNYDYVGTTTDPVVALNISDSAEFGPDSGYSGDYDTNIVYNDRGPLSVTYIITASGQGGTVSEVFTIPILIDDTPDNINIEESDDLLKDADPVLTPDTEILSEMILIDDVDIQVEIKSDYPIDVDVNANNQWTSIRQIGSPPAVQGGNSLSLTSPDRSENTLAIARNSVPDEDPPTFDLETNAASFSFSGGANSVAIMQGGSVTFTWSLSGGYTSASITNHGTLSQTSGATTYNTRTIFRWFGPNPPPGDHMCALSNPGGYTSVIAFCQFFTTPPPGSFGGVDAEAPGVKPQSGLMGYVWPVGYLPPGASTQLVYEYVDPNGGTPTGFGTIWTLSSTGEGPYTIFNQAFRVPTAAWTDYSTVTFGGSATKSPTTTTSYTITATGPYVGTYTKTITATVYVPPTISFTSSLGTAIVAGQSTIIYWTVAGDANTISWTSGDITNTNLNSNSTVTPIDTTTYCAVASGLGGTSPNTCITITVYQIPTASLTVPAVVDYNENFSIEYDTKYANTSITITPTYQYLDGTSVTGTAITRTAATGAELGDPDSATVRSGTIPITVPWNDFGPYQIIFAITATGSGGSASVLPATVLVNIDQTPDNFTIEESDGLLKDADPVITPDTEILSEMYLIDDIDIPVEVKSDYPIMVDVNGGEDWENIREIGSGLPPAGGSSLPENDDIDISVEWSRLPDHD